jgi:pimeloyl-ACP methyl ester carboxylesterase
MKKILSFILALGMFSMACQTLMPTPAPVGPVTQVPSESSQETPGTLTELGGKPCEENPDLTCISLQVPLDHFDAANPETIEVVFGVLPARGVRYGMFVQAFPGGPGGEGISSAYWNYYSDEILEHFDIVYFDQRGIGLSTPLECPLAYEKDFIRYLTEFNTAGEEGYDTPAEQQAAIENARTYAEECIAEIGIEPEKLAFFGTDQVAGDIEAFRQFMGEEKFWMYGVSYGTAVAQTYARAHPERLNALVLDGTINMTLSGVESALSQEQALDKVLVAVLTACNADAACSADMGGRDAVAVYDDLAAKVSKSPIPYEFPLPNGEKISGAFTFNQLEYTASYQLYSLTGRMILLKALAAAGQGDLVPMLRLMYVNTTMDPATFTYKGDSTFSDTMFLSVLCTDDAFFSGTQEERIRQTIEAGQASNGTVPRLDGSVYTGLSCAFWPSSPQEETPREPLVLEGVPVLVLNAKLDPATPFEEGEAVFKNLADGYHIYVEGGVHSIYGYGYACPDDYVTDLLVNGSVPEAREIVCEEWGTAAYSNYIPNLPGDVSEFENPLEMISSLDDNLYYLPEAYYSEWEEGRMETVGCTYGGTYSFGLTGTGDEYKYDQCSMVPGLVITGSGEYNFNTRTFTATLDVSGAKSGSLTYTYNYNRHVATVRGEYGGEPVDLTRED